MGSHGSQEKCFLCPEVSSTQCELCDCQISHCEAHQRFHRPAGEGPCFPYLVSEVAGVGRMMVAARGVAAGEELWREEDTEDTQEEFGIVSQDNTRQDIAWI